MGFLDMRTILTVQAATTAISAWVVLLLWLQSRRRFAGTHYWALDFFFQTLAILLILFRGLVPDFFSITLANAFIIAGGMFGLWGVKSFSALVNRRWPDLIVLGAFVFVSVYFTFVVPDLRWRIVNTSLGIAFFNFFSAWTIFFRISRPMGRFLYSAGAVFALFTAVGLIRIGYFISVPLQKEDLFQSNRGDVLLILAFQLLLILLAYTLNLAVNRRLFTDIRLEEEKFYKAFRSSPYALMLTRLADGRIQEVNDGFVQLSGYSQEEALGKTTQELGLWAREEDRSILTEALLREGRMGGKEFVFRVKSGEKLIGLVTAEALKINDEPHILSSVQDITARKKAEEALKDSEERYRKVVENASEAILVAQEGRIRFHNRKTNELIGFSDEELESKAFTDFIHPEDREKVFQRYQARLKGEEVPSVYPFRVIDKSGRVRWVEINAVLISWEGKPATLNILNDISERKIMEERLEQLTVQDELTGLYNRRGFLALAEQQMKIEERRGQKLVLYFADLDRMKWINDTLGHQEGDRALQDLSRILKDTFRDADVIGRMGGDEFAVLALDMDQLDPRILMNRLADNLLAFHQREERPFHLSLSVGFAEYDPTHPVSLDQLLAEADRRMYEEKRKKKEMEIHRVA